MTRDWGGGGGFTAIGGSGTRCARIALRKAPYHETEDFMVDQDTQVTVKGANFYTSD